MKKLTLLVYLVLIPALLSCGVDEGEEEIEEVIEQEEVVNSETSFSNEETGAFNGVLNLNQNLFNHANLNIPEYFDESSGSFPFQDNTPEDNRITDAGATLGRVLFFDKNLSANNTIYCASCHQQEKGFSDPARFSVGLNGETTKRNSITIINSDGIKREGSAGMNGQLP